MGTWMHMQDRHQIGTSIKMGLLNCSFGMTAVALLAICLVASDSLAGSRADSHAAIGVMADHTHNAGEWMFSYRYMRMRMDGNREGSHRVSAASVLNKFSVAPIRMDMEMHMFASCTRRSTKSR